MPELDLLITDLARELLLVAVMIAAPMLMAGLIVGVAVSLFQALTSVQEQTLSMIPKMMAVMGVALLLLAPALGVLRDYTVRIISQLNSFGLQ